MQRERESERYRDREEESERERTIKLIFMVYVHHYSTNALELIMTYTKINLPDG